MPRPKNTRLWEQKDDGYTGPCSLNGPVKWVCVRCKKNYVDKFTTPKICDDCLTVSKEVKDFFKKLRSQGKVKSVKKS